MAKVLVVVFLIFGTVVGSGFSSGKEIMVFFSRFGEWSYLFILLAGGLFFLLFYFFLSRGKRLNDCLEKYKFLSIIMLFISLIFCSSMFAGIKNLCSYLPSWMYYSAIIFLLLCTSFVTLRGIAGLEKVNLLLMPLTSILFVIVLAYEAFLPSTPFVATNAAAGVLYCPLYVALNTCMSGIIICKSGEGLSKKQIALASGIATALILLFLLLGNFVLQRNGASIISEMPFLAIAGNNAMFFVAYFVIMVGCFTTLISLCYTLKTSFEKWTNDNLFSTFLAVLLPFAISSLGFSRIVSFLYPICSVLGVLMLFVMLVGAKKCNAS